MRVAINGLGRIGRGVLKAGLEKGINFVAINDLADPKTLAYLLKYDSVYGVYGREIKVGKDFIDISGKKIKILSEPNPDNLPWRELKVDIVIESTGAFKERSDFEKHLHAGAGKVVITAPADEPDITVVLGVNEKRLTKNHKIISMASCTTNCLAPVAKVLNDRFGIKKGFMNTIHAYTASQGLVDMPDKKLRRGRSAAENIVPTTSGATTATSKVIPDLAKKMDGLALRVPVVCGSIVDFTAILKKSVTKEQVNNAFKKAAKENLKGILEYTEDELVSRDVIKNSHISIVDGNLTQTLGNLVKILAWYDNEYGYSVKIIELLKKL